MSAFNTITITSTGTETNFLTMIYNYIMGLWGGITCSVTPEDSATISPGTPSDFTWVSGKTCYMDFNLGNGATLRIQNKYHGSRSRQYHVALIVNDIEVVFKGAVGSDSGLKDGILFAGNDSYQSDGPSPTSNTTRQYVCASYVSDYVKALWIAPHNSASYTSAVFSIIGFADTEDVWHWGGGTSSLPLNGSIYNLDGATTATAINVLTYACSAGEIDYIAQTGFTSGGTKIYSVSNIYSSSTLSAGSSISLSDGNYFAIGANHIVKL